MFKLGLREFTMHRAPLKAHMYLEMMSLPRLAKSTNWWPTAGPALAGMKAIYDNDILGCCTISGVLHNIVAMTANAGDLVIPTNADALAGYEQFDGYVDGDPSTDQGGTLLNVAQCMVKTGIAGVKAAAFIEINPQIPVHVKYALQLLGPTQNFGISLPQAWMTIAQNAQPGETLVWDYVPSADNTIIGGHDVACIDFDEHGNYWCDSWGFKVRMTHTGFAHFVTEISALVFPEFITKSGKTPSGLDLDQLLADAKSLAEA